MSFAENMKPEENTARIELLRQIHADQLDVAIKSRDRAEEIAERQDKRLKRLTLWVGAALGVLTAAATALGVAYAAGGWVKGLATKPEVSASVAEVEARVSVELAKTQRNHAALDGRMTNAESKIDVLKKSTDDISANVRSLLDQTLSVSRTVGAPIIPSRHKEGADAGGRR